MKDTTNNITLYPIKLKETSDDNWCKDPSSTKESYYNIVCWNAADKHGD